MNNSIIQVDSKFYKKCKVVMLPTKDRSKVGVNPSRLSKNKLYYFDPVVHGEAQHLYILSDEEIKEGDWTNYDDVIVKVKSKREADSANRNNWKKIIATTDTQLNNHQGTLEYPLGIQSLPRPSDAFLKAYCEQGGIDEVLVEYEQYFKQNRPETEPLYRLKIAPDNTITIKPVNDTSKIDHLQWIYDRMVNVQNEYPESDYMIKFKDIINSLKNK